MDTLTADQAAKLVEKHGSKAAAVRRPHGAGWGRAFAMIYRRFYSTA